jgi:hypothetical protein
VNVALLGILSLLGMLNRATGWMETIPNAHAFLRTVWYINLGLLIFNLLPIFPLDGGQILRSLLWFVVGRIRSLMAATVIGIVGGVGFIGFAYWQHSPWLGLIAVFVLMNCWSGLQQARVLSRLAKLPRHPGFACPACKAAPLVGALWKCNRCEQAFDTFVTRAVCPNCSMQFPVTLCPDCRALHPMSEWIATAPSTERR